MRTTIDKAGRVVIPKALRDQVGLAPGEVELVVDGAGVRVEPVAAGEIRERRDGRAVIASAGHPIGDEDVRALRDATRR